MGLVLGPFGDPALEQAFCRRSERLCRLAAGHHLVGVVAEDAGDQLALVGLAGDDRLLGEGRLADVEPEAGLAVVLVRAVAEKQFSERIGRMNSL